MGKITNLLNKVQESRPYDSNQKMVAPFYVENKGQGQRFPKKAIIMLVIFMVCGMGAVAFMGGKIFTLEKSLKTQEKRIADFAAFLGQDKNFSIDQMTDVNDRLTNEIQDRKIQVSHLNLVDSTYYINIIKSLHANTLQIKDLKSTVDKMVIEGNIKDPSFHPNEVEKPVVK